MYYPWWARKIFNRLILENYFEYTKGAPINNNDFNLYKEYSKYSLNIIFYPRYLWKTKGILNKLITLKNYKNTDCIFNVKKEYDLLFYGCIDAPLNCDIYTEKIIMNSSHINKQYIYIFRKRLYKLLREHPSLKKYRIKIIDWISKNEDGGIYDADLFDIISKSKFTIATCSSVQYLLRKYYEIPMAGSLIIGNIPEYAPKIFSKNMTEIKMSMTDNEIINIIENSIENYDKYTNRKNNLGKKLIELASIIKNDNEYIEDMIYYKKNKIKTRRLNDFLKILNCTPLTSLKSEYYHNY